MTDEAAKNLARGGAERLRQVAVTSGRLSARRGWDAGARVLLLNGSAGSAPPCNDNTQVGD